jgi:hypothetical protein
MKQTEDTATLELPHMGAVITLDNQNTHMRTEKYRFFIGLTDGTEVEWCGLSRKQARDMYAYTNAHHPCNITGCGWELIK